MSHAGILFLVVCFGSVQNAQSCDAAGMSSCNQDYTSALTSASGSDACQVIDTMLACLNTACAGCDDAVKQQFNAIVGPIKSSGSCQASGSCANSTICIAADPLTCGAGAGQESSGIGRMSLCWVIATLIFFVSMETTQSCDAAGMSACNEAYLSAVTSASGTDACQTIDTMLACLNTACTGCDDAVKQQFNAIVGPIKSSGSCQASGACANSTICAASDPLTCSAAANGESSGVGRMCASALVVAMGVVCVLFASTQ